MAVEGGPSGGGLSVHYESLGQAPSAVIVHWNLSGVDLVSIRAPLFHSLPAGIPMNLEALNRVSLAGDRPDSPWVAPYGLSLMGSDLPVLQMNTALPLAELPRSQFNFALSQVLLSTFALYQILGIDPNL